MDRVPHQPGRHRGEPAAEGADRGAGAGDDPAYLALAVHMATRNVAAGGAPFGAVAVAGDLVLGLGTNEVSHSYDPTAHAEVVAIRAACRRLARTDLSDCILYCSCEPCPLCLAVAHWAGLTHVVYAVSRDRARDAGFGDALDDAFAVTPAARGLLVGRPDTPAALAPFEAWQALTAR